ncbi:MAG TPA: hypothetical protein VHQ47_02635 [Phycisphaerae bacterium]|jgi:hypothetical protein|nr:hypothetical protein [Phycisphaerae bacterium]
MATIFRGKPDPELLQVQRAMERFEADHPGAHADLYRQNSVSIRVRVLSDHFRAMTRADRHDEVWKYLESLDSRILEQISVLLPLAAGEKQRSMANMDFEDPLPSAIG